jgi:hypothetical protein
MGKRLLANLSPHPSRKMPPSRALGGIFLDGCLFVIFSQVFAEVFNLLEKL